MSQGRRTSRPSKSGLAATWGGRIKARRELLGLRQDTLEGFCSKYGGVSQQTISRVENGVINPSFDLLVRICAGLGAEPAELLSWPPLSELVTVQQEIEVAS